MLMIMEEIFYSVSAMEPLTWSMFSQRIYNYRVSMGFTSLLINIVVWSLLTIYLEQVFPN